MTRQDPLNSAGVPESRLQTEKCLGKSNLSESRITSDLPSWSSIAVLDSGLDKSVILLSAAALLPFILFLSSASFNVTGAYCLAYPSVLLPTCLHRTLQNAWPAKWPLSLVSSQT